MVTNIGQYTPVFLPGEPPSLTEKPGRLWSTGSQWIGHYKSDPVCRDARLLLPVAALPQWEVSVKVAQLLGLRGPWRCQACRDTDCLCCRSHGPIRVFFWASCTWRSEGLFGQSFSTSTPIRALRGLPCLGVLFCCSARQAHRGPPWLGSCSAVQCFRCLMGQPLYCSAAMLACGERGAKVMAPSPTCDSAVLPCFHAARLSSTGISQPQSPPSHPLNLSLSSQQEASPWDCSTVPKLQFPDAMPCRGPEPLSGVCMAASRTVWFSFHWGCHRSAVSLSAWNVSPLTQK